MFSGASAASNFFTLPFRKKKQRYVINPPDETYDVVYLGNVLTVMARGENCYEKPLSLIWKSYCTRARSDLAMSLEVTRSGLKAMTKQQGLTEYWGHRITFSAAPAEYPKVFCWIYKHDGKRLRPELRCHAVLCRKSSEPPAMHLKLTEHLQAALQEYKREKLTLQNARATGSIGCPRRKLLLQTGSLNFRPPVSRSKSAPRLGSIDEEQEDLDVSDSEESVCYRAAPDSASMTSQADSISQHKPSSQGSGGSESGYAGGSSSECSCSTSSDDQPTRSRPPLTDADNISDESGFHDENKCHRELSEELYYSDSELVLVEDEYDEDDEEQVTAL